MKLYDLVQIKTNCTLYPSAFGIVIALYTEDARLYIKGRSLLFYHYEFDVVQSSFDETRHESR